MIRRGRPQSSPALRAARSVAAGPTRGRARGQSVDAPPDAEDAAGVEAPDDSPPPEDWLPPDDEDPVPESDDDEPLPPDEADVDEPDGEDERASFL